MLDRWQVLFLVHCLTVSTSLSDQLKVTSRGCGSVVYFHPSAPLMWWILFPIALACISAVVVVLGTRWVASGVLFSRRFCLTYFVFPHDLLMLHLPSALCKFQLLGCGRHLLLAHSSCFLVAFILSAPSVSPNKIKSRVFNLNLRSRSPASLSCKAKYEILTDRSDLLNRPLVCFIFSILFLTSWARNYAINASF